MTAAAGRERADHPQLRGGARVPGTAVVGVIAAGRDHRVTHVPRAVVVLPAGRAGTRQDGQRHQQQAEERRRPHRCAGRSVSAGRGGRSAMKR